MAVFEKSPPELVARFLNVGPNAQQVAGGTHLAPASFHHAVAGPLARFPSWTRAEPVYARRTRGSEPGRDRRVVRINSTVPEFVRLRDVTPGEARVKAWRDQYEAAHRSAFQTYYRAWGDP